MESFLISDSEAELRLRNIYAKILDEATSLEDTIRNTIPDCRERSLAITHLEEVVLWSNAAISRKLG